MTIYRRRRDFGILLNPHREVSGEELTGIIQQLRHDNPYCGETMIMGHLRAMDVAVTRERVRSVSEGLIPLIQFYVGVVLLGGHTLFQGPIHCGI